MEPLLPTGSDFAAAEAYAAGALIGARVRLRALREEDLPLLAEWWTDTHTAIHQTATLNPRPADGTMELLRMWTRNERPASGAAFAVETLEGELLGWVSLFGAAWPQRSAELGISLGPAATGSGYGPETVRLMVRHGFAELGLHRISLRVMAYNTRGIAAYEKVGFVREGVIREAVWHGGAWHDEVVMGLLDREWQA